MKNITFSADEKLIEKARLKAAKEKTTLNQRFRDWLSSYAKQNNAGSNYDKLMDELEHVNSGGKFTRDEMNER
jgi:predicted glycosyltransferase